MMESLLLSWSSLPVHSVLIHSRRLRCLCSSAPIHSIGSAFLTARMSRQGKIWTSFSPCYSMRSHGFHLHKLFVMLHLMLLLDLTSSSVVLPSSASSSASLPSSSPLLSSKIDCLIDSKKGFSNSANVYQCARSQKCCFEYAKPSCCGSKPATLILWEIFSFHQSNHFSFVFYIPHVTLELAVDILSYYHAFFLLLVLHLVSFLEFLFLIWCCSRRSMFSYAFIVYFCHSKRVIPYFTFLKKIQFLIFLEKH